MSRRIMNALTIALISQLGIVLNALLGYIPSLHPDLFTGRVWLFGA